MQEFVKVAVDAMGGDNAPVEIVKGCIDAVNEEPSLKVFLVGQEAAVNAELSKYTYNKEQVEVVNAEEVIDMAEPPVMAIRKKKDSSIVKALYMVKNKEADAYVSAGSTGATLAGGQLVVGRIKGVERAPLGAIIPTEKGGALLVDCGANVDSRASHLVQFAKIGSVYMENIMNKANPTVAIVSNGAEEEKGNALVKEAYPLLKNCPDINFVGSIEAREIPAGAADVIVAEGFTGNAILKMYEGVGKTMLNTLKKTMFSNAKTKLGELLIKKEHKENMKQFSLDQYGGAPMLGLNGLVMKTHGSSKAVEIKNTVLQCVAFSQKNINQKIIDKISSED